MSQQQRNPSPTSGSVLSGGEQIMTGRAWRAVVRLTAKDRTVLAAAGATCERVPLGSWPWLIAQGLMVPTACTCGHTDTDNVRVPDPACPVDHAPLALVIDVAGVTAALAAALAPAGKA
jgi:hypothetical protein